MASIDFSSIGSSGLKQFDGYIFDEWMPELQGARGRRVLREMQDNDPIIAGLLLALELLIRQTSWTITPGRDDAAGKAAAEFVDQCRTDMGTADTPITWPDTISEIQSFLPYGWSLHEQVYKYRRGGATSKYSDG